LSEAPGFTSSLRPAFPSFGGWSGLAGFVFGIWFGGTMGGVTGGREWAVLTEMLVGVAVLALGLVSCVYAMARYG